MTGQLLATAGPFKGTRYVNDAPYEDASQYAMRCVNGYYPSPATDLSWLSRPGCSNPNSAAQMGTGQRMQGTHAHVDPATSTVYRFFAVNGKLYRSTSTFATAADVSPVGITIDTAASTRVSMISVGASMVVTDGVNRPWIASNFGGSPITGTYIDIDGGGGSWSTWGKPTIYEDSIIFITQTVPGGSAIQARIGIVWCEPNQPAVGYTQSGYADFWNMIETGSDPLYAILGTNSGFFFWRAAGIGVANGTPSINFSTTATRDARGEAIGSVSPWAVALFQNNIFFLDTRGRPWMMPLDGDPKPIWQQLTTLTVSHQSALDPTTLSWLAVGAIAPELNQYVAAIWSDSPSTNRSPNVASAFDGQTGTYSGDWFIGNTIGIDVLDTQLDANGMRVLCIGGGAVGAASGGYIWILNALNAGVWNDDGVSPAGFLFVTGRMGYSASRNMHPDYANIIVHSTDVMQGIICQTSYESVTVPNVTPASQSHAPSTGDTPQEFLAVLGLDGNATRWLGLYIQGPATLTAQWGVQRIELYGSMSGLGAGEA